MLNPGMLQLHPLKEISWRHLQRLLSASFTWLQLLLKGIQLWQLLQSNFSGGAETVLKTVGKSSPNGSFIIICAKSVKQSQEKPHFHGSSLVEKQLQLFRVSSLEQFLGWTFGRASAPYQTCPESVCLQKGQETLPYPCALIKYGQLVFGQGIFGSQLAYSNKIK